ncbi:MAG: hypothetical protein HC869_15165 [Rhodospirillales bacterium]|nr:hypothetical protein [Rhodospirillales bacterium]
MGRGQAQLVFIDQNGRSCSSAAKNINKQFERLASEAPHVVLAIRLAGFHRDGAVFRPAHGNAAVTRLVAFLDSRVHGDFLIGDRLSIADLAIISNLLDYRYLGYAIDERRYPRLAGYCAGLARLDVTAQTLPRSSRPWMPAKTIAVYSNQPGQVRICERLGVKLPCATRHSPNLIHMSEVIADAELSAFALCVPSG